MDSLDTSVECIFVVDDCSSAIVRGEVARVCGLDIRVQLLNVAKRQGASFCRNLGAEQAQTEWLLFLDDDADGYGNPDVSVEACEAGSGLVENDADCNDFDPHVNPDAEEVCNERDDDCDDEVDERCTRLVDEQGLQGSRGARHARDAQVVASLIVKGDPLRIELIESAAGGAVQRDKAPV